MKKIIVLNLALLFTAVLNISFSKSTGGSFIKDHPVHITTLIINADVTVVLVNDEKATLQVSGGNSFTKFITFKKTNDTLVVNSTRDKDLKDAGVIYVHASQLRKVQINSEAYVLSLYSLEVPKLDVVINGTCKIAISNLGKVNLIATDSYSLEQTTEVRRYPANIFLKKNDPVFIAEK